MADLHNLNEDILAAKKQVREGQSKLIDAYLTSLKTNYHVLVEDYQANLASNLEQLVKSVANGAVPMYRPQPMTRTSFVFDPAAAVATRTKLGLEAAKVLEILGYTEPKHSTLLSRYETGSRKPKLHLPFAKDYIRWLKANGYNQEVLR